MIQPTKILVTGGAGFIGSNFLNLMVREHPEVEFVNLDALTYAGNLENLKEIEHAPNYRFILGDIRDREFIKKLFKQEQFSGVINFAAESHVDRSIENPSVFLETNVNGTGNLLQASLETQVNRYLQVSTDEVYGSLGPDDPPFSEETPLHPNSPYAASKAAADHLVWSFHHTYGLNVVITRCSNNYGMYQFPEKMIPLMFERARKNQYLPVYGDGLQIRDWIFVQDHIRAVWEVFIRGRAGHVYNIGGGNEKTNLEVVKLILDFLGKPYSLIRHVQDRPGHDRRYAINSNKIRQELGWKPLVPFEEGLRVTLQWFLEHEDWMNRVTSGIYQEYYARMYKNR